MPKKSANFSNDLQKILSDVQELKSRAAHTPEALNAFEAYKTEIIKANEKGRYIDQSLEFYAEMYDAYGASFVAELQPILFPTLVEKFLLNPNIPDEMRFANWQYQATSANADKIFNCGLSSRPSDEVAALRFNAPTLVQLLDRLAGNGNYAGEIKRFYSVLMQEDNMWEIPLKFLAKSKVYNLAALFQPPKPIAIAPVTINEDLQNKLHTYLSNNVFITGIHPDAKTGEYLTLDEKFAAIKKLSNIQYCFAKLDTEFVPLMQSVVPVHIALNTLFDTLYKDYSAYEKAHTAWQVKLEKYLETQKDELEVAGDDDDTDDAQTNIKKAEKKLARLPLHTQAMACKQAHFLIKLFNHPVMQTLLLQNLRETEKDPLKMQTAFGFKQYLYNNPVASGFMVKEITRLSNASSLASEDRQNLILALHTDVFIKALHPSLLTRFVNWVTGSYHVKDDISIETLMKRVRATETAADRSEILKEIFTTNYWHQLNKSHWVEIWTYFRNDCPYTYELNTKYERWLKANSTSVIAKESLRLEIEQTERTLRQSKIEHCSTVIMRQHLQQHPLPINNKDVARKLKRKIEQLSEQQAALNQNLHTMQHQLDKPVQQQAPLDLTEYQTRLKDIENTLQAKWDETSKIIVENEQVTALKEQLEQYKMRVEELSTELQNHKKSITANSTGKGKNRRNSGSASTPNLQKIVGLEAKIEELSRTVNTSLTKAGQLAGTFHMRIAQVELQQQVPYYGSPLRPTQPAAKNPQTPDFSPLPQQQQVDSPADFSPM